MGAALDAIGDTGAALRRNPNVLLGAVASGLVLLIGLVVALVPILGGFAYGVVVVPVALVGLVTMCDAAVEGPSSLGDFTDGIGRHGASAIAAYGLWTLLQVAVVVVLVVVAFVAGAGLFAAGAGPGAADGGEPSAGALAGTSAAAALLFVVFFIVFFVLGVIQQFLDVAVVLGADGGVEAVKEAVAVVRDGPVSTLGYLLVRSGLTVLGALPTVVLAGMAAAVGGASAAGAGDVVPGTVAAGGGVLSVALGVLAVVLFPLALAVSFVYHVAYYRRRRPETAGTGGAPSSTPSGRRPDDPQRATD